MPSGAAVIRYDGKRGVVWRIKYADADGRQVMETLGPEREGWTERKAEAELRERLVRVERRGWRRPAPLTFSEYAETWFSEGENRRRWKPATVAQYRSIKQRLVEHFGPMPPAAIRPRHVAEYVAEASASYGAATVSRDVSLLHAIFSTAKREELVDSNPAERAERPKVPKRSWRILEREEVARIAKAFTDEQARAVFLTLVLTGLRRSELQRLRWRDVDLLEGVLRVVVSKSEEGERSIALSPRLQAELAEHYRRTAFKGADELVFCHPERGTTYRAEAFQEALTAALAVAGVEGKLRAFHDLRHSSLTLGAAAGEGAIALMSRAGHRNMATTRTYLHLAGTVFRDEAEALERRLLGGVEPPPDVVGLGSPSLTLADGHVDDPR
jgi:integrase